MASYTLMSYHVMLCYIKAAAQLQQRRDELLGGQQELQERVQNLRKARGKRLHTRIHRSEHPLENATENPLD